MKRMITRFGPDGANLGSVSATPSNEACRLGPGETWCEGQHDGCRDPATGKIMGLRAMPVIRADNRLTGIPEGATVIVNGEVVASIGGMLDLDVAHAEDVSVRLAHPLYAFAAFDLPCRPEANRGGHRIAQDYARMRLNGYARVASQADQLDAIIKALRAVIAHLPAETRAAIPTDALVVLDGIADVKARIPKEPRPKVARKGSTP